MIFGSVLEKCVIIEKFINLCYNNIVSTSSQIRLQMVRGNAGGIVLSGMYAFVCGTYSPIYSSYTYTVTIVLGRECVCRCVPV